MKYTTTQEFDESNKKDACKLEDLSIEVFSDAACATKDEASTTKYGKFFSNDGYFGYNLYYHSFCEEEQLILK